MAPLVPLTKPLLNNRLIGVDFAGTSDQTGFSTIANVTTCSIAFVAKAGHIYRVSGKAYVTQNTGAGIVTLSVRESTTVVGVLDEQSVATAGTAALSGEDIVCSPTAGAHTYVLSVATSTNTADLELSDATKRAYLCIEDLGFDPTV